jgi:hypothetical protein
MRTGTSIELRNPKPRRGGSELQEEAATDEEDHREEKVAISLRHTSSPGINPSTMLRSQGKIGGTRKGGREGGRKASLH